MKNTVDRAGTIVEHKYCKGSERKWSDFEQISTGQSERGPCLINWWVFMASWREFMSTGYQVNC